ncbi:MAG TPA: class I SAM-dependent methyltransferase [Solirubrobacteraceae bacterium]|nr:class I SAM-dependent methyltransferase [Solirubrobacteraceae bacterium]
MPDTHLTPTGSGIWSRMFAAIYEPSLLVGELAGMRRRRRALLSAATGRTLEIGGGTGLNLGHYGEAVSELIVAEPSPPMRRRLERRAELATEAAEQTAGKVRVIDAPAERLPFDDASLDTVVSTLVLCTVDDPAAALSEIVRVLRPDGRLLFIEHVRAESRALAWWQDRLAGPWRRFAEGCRCNRPTASLMAASGLAVDASAAKWRTMPHIVRPLITGYATKA